MESRGGSNSSTSSTGESSSLSKEYSSTVEYSVENRQSETKSIEYRSNATGYYRIVTAGTLHVFAVVGYDIATNSFYTYSYSVLDKERHEYLDYSKDNANFNDCENAVLPFEVPYDVYDYISVKIAKSSGLTINSETGVVVEKYTGDAEYVVIPEYMSVYEPGVGNTAIRVTGINAEVFKGNTKIKGVLLPKYVHEIPNGAFEGCTSLETVIGYGIDQIGDNAFKGCCSLQPFIVDELINSLGHNAFEGINAIYVGAKNVSVAEAALDSGAKKITLNLSDMAGSFDNKKINIGEDKEFFGLISNGKSYSNLQVISKSAETFLCNMALKNNTDTPLNIKSNKVTLSKVNVENSPGFALILPNENTELKLFGTVELSSQGENAVISKSVSLDKANSEVAGKLKLTGNYLICGDLANDKMLKFTSGRLIEITESQFDSYLTSSVVTFDANGGSTSIQSKTVYYDQKFGELPTPERQYYTFEGWFTEKEGGTKITADTNVNTLVNITLYARWTLNSFVVTFNANGGSCSTSTLRGYCGKALGTLPTPSRDYYTFDGWYTEVEGGTEVTADTVYDVAENITLYAHWTQNPVKGWVLASAIPSDAQVTERKYSYTQRSYTESGSSSLSGWTKYDTRRTSWGGWSNWQTWNPDNGVRNVEWRSAYDHTEYHYYRWTNSSHTAIYTYKTSSYGCTILEENWFNYQLPLVSGNSYIGYNGDTSYANRWVQANYDGNYSVDKTWTRDIYRDEWRYQEPIYTYYYYKDENKESSSYPSSSNISNIQEWVMYREK